MLDGAMRELSGYRLVQARDCLQVSEIAIEKALYRDSLNRSYYCIFHSIRAVLAFDNYDSKKHSGIIDEFRKRYIKTGKFDTRFSKIIGNAFKLRNESDYDDFFVVSKSDVVQQMEEAKELLMVVAEYVKTLSENNT
jgi:hypothetical protein